MLPMRLLALSLITTLLVAGCGDGGEDEPGECGPNGECDPGFVCDPRINRCVRSGTVPDARPIDGPGIDAGAADAGADAMVSIPDAGSGLDADINVIDTEILSGPSGPTASDDPSFTFRSIPAGLSFECSLDGAGFTACTSPRAFMNLAAGEHTFRVRARTPTRVDETPASRTFTIDVELPVALITGGPTDDSIVGPSGTFTYTTSPLDEEATFECALDSTLFTACETTGFDFGPLAHGTEHTFQVRAVNDAGEGEPDSRTFTIDANGPVVTITNPLNGGTVGTSFAATFTFEPEVGATFVCTLDGTTVVAGCTSGHIFSMVSPGAHVLTVQGTDAVGNEGPVAQSDFTVAANVEVAIVFPLDGETTGPTGQITYTTGNAVSLECTLDELPVNCLMAGVFAFQNLTHGNHTFTIRGLDAGGAPGPIDSVTWRVDALGPFVNIDTPSDDRAGGQGFTCPDGTITLECDMGQSDDGDCPAQSLDCSLDGGSFEDCSSGSFSFTGLSGGLHELEANATDGFGNIGETERVTWEVDATGPSFEIVEPTAGSTPSSGGSGSISLSPLEDGAFVTACTVDAGRDSEQDCSDLSYSGLSDADNPHTLDVTVSDPCGNETTESITFTVDTTAPQVTVLTGTPGTAGDGSITFNATLTDASTITAVFTRLDRTSFANRGAGPSIARTETQLAAGEHVFEVYGVDQWGNSGELVAETDGTSAHRRVFATETYPPNMGRLVAIGHDYASIPNEQLVALLGNAVNLAPFRQVPLSFTRPIRVVGYNRGTVTPAERTNALDAIEERLDTLGVPWTVSTDYSEFSGASDAALREALFNDDVLLIFDQNDTSGANTTIGTTWGPRLLAFLNAGGVVILLDGRVGASQTPSGTVDMVSAPFTGGPLLEAEADEDPAFEAFLDEVLDDHPLAADVGDSYDPFMHTVGFHFEDDVGQPLEVYAAGLDCPGSECFESGATVLDKIFPVYTLEAEVSTAPSGAFCPTGSISLGVTPASGVGFPTMASFTCELDESGEDACDPGDSIPYTSDSSLTFHQFVYRAIDRFGNPGRLVRQFFSVDTNGPFVITLSSGLCDDGECPDGFFCGNGENGCNNNLCCQNTVKGPTDDVYFRELFGDEPPGATFMCSFDDGPFTECRNASNQPCAFPYSLCTVRYSGLACQQSHTLTIQSRDECAAQGGGVETTTFDFVVECPVP